MFVQPAVKHDTSSFSHFEGHFLRDTNYEIQHRQIINQVSLKTLLVLFHQAMRSFFAVNDIINNFLAVS